MIRGFSTSGAFKQASVVDGACELGEQELEQLQQALVDMLADISLACIRCETPFVLAYGSCLGSVRHGGFVPWDDDLDIAMLRKDYVRFEAMFDRHLGDRYVLLSPDRTEGYDLAFPRIRKKGTVLKNRDDFFATEDCGIYIDLFVLENVPDNAVLRVLHGTVSLGLGFVYSCRRFAKYGTHYLRLAEGDAELVRVFKAKAAMGHLFSFRSVGAWTKSWYRWNANCRNDQSKCLSVPVGPRHYFGEMQSRSVVCPYGEGPFCDNAMPLPADPVAYLTALYGESFMEIPAEDQRQRHVVLEFDLHPDLEA